MRFFLDTEFAENGRTIDLISIGVVSQDGKEFYRQSADASLRAANSWVQAHVVPKLDRCPSGLKGSDHRFGLCAKKDECPWRPRRLIAKELYTFIGYSSAADPLSLIRPEFWGYYADYDWVAVCQLYGEMADLPPGWPMYCRDLKQWADDAGINLASLPQSNEHHALSDARWNRLAYNVLVADKRLQEVERAKGKEAGAVDQEPGHVRSDQARSSRAGKGGRRKDLQCRSGEGLQEGSTQVRQEDTPVGGIGGILT